MPDLRLHWENDLTLEDHERLTTLLARAYPAWTSLFVARHSWYLARPEFRVVLYEGERPVAHLGAMRRFLRAGEEHALVGDLGLVAVDPDRQGGGLGKELLRHTKEILAGLGVPHGFLTCRPEIVPFYESAGWERLPDQVSRLIDRTDETEVYSGPTMLLRVSGSAEPWPAGVLDRNGLEI